MSNLLLRPLVLAAIAISSLVLVACGSDSDSNSTEAEGPDASSTVSSEAPQGAPIKFSVLYPAAGPNASPSVLEGAQAAADAINAAGGVQPKGGGEARPIELVPCDADNTKNPSQPAECAKQVIADGVVLDVAKYTLSGDEVDVFAANGVAMLGNNPFSQQDLTNDLSFPLSGATATLVPGTAAALQNAGSKKVTYLSVDIPAAHAAAGFIEPVLESPADLIDTVLLPTDPAADLNPFFAKLVAKDPEGVILGVPPIMMAQVVTGLRQAGYEGQFVATPFTLPADVIEALGPEAEGMLSASDYASAVSTDDPAITEFNEGLDEYAPDAERDEYALNSWATVHLAAEIAAELPKIDKASFAEALQGHPADIGIAPPFTLGKKDIYLPFPRVFRATVQYQVVEDGAIVPDGNGEFVDLNELAAK